VCGGCTGLRISAARWHTDPAGSLEIQSLFLTFSQVPSQLRIRRLYRPEDISREVAYRSGWWDVFVGPEEEGLTITPEPVVAKCGAVTKTEAEASRLPVGGGWVWLGKLNTILAARAIQQQMQRSRKEEAAAKRAREESPFSSRSPSTNTHTRTHARTHCHVFCC
jgi:hypothetical protein